MTTWDVYIDWDADGDFDDAYENIWDDVIQARWRIGSGRAYQNAADESVCVIELQNSDGKYNPENASSPLYGSLLPQRPVKITATVGGNTQVMWRGWVERIEPDWEPAGGQTGKTAAAIHCVGAKELLQKASVNLPLQQNKRADEIIAEVLRRVVLPPAVSGGWLLGKAGYSELGVNTILASESDYSSLERGDLRFGYYGDVRGTSREDGSNGYRIIQDVTAAEGGYFFFDREGKAVFWNRSHRLDAVVDDDIVDTDGVLGTRPARLRYAYGASVANQVEVRCFQRQEGGTITLWSLDKPLTIAAGGTVRFEAPFTDDKRRRAGALSASAANVVYSGGSLAISLDRKAERAIVTTTNSGAVDATLTGMDIQGQVLTAHNQMIVRREDADSIRSYGQRQGLLLNLKALDDYNEAVDIAEYELNRRKNPRGEVQQIMLVNAADGSANAKQLAWTIGTRLRVVANEFGHDAAYFVVGEQHTVSGGGRVHETVLILEPNSEDRMAYVSKWYLDENIALQGADGKKLLAQGFVIQHDRDISYARLRLRKIGNPAGTLRLRIYGDKTVANQWILGESGYSNLGTQTYLATDNGMGPVPPQGLAGFPDFDFGSDVCTDGTPNTGTYPANLSNLFDDDSGTFWEGGTPTPASPEWVSYDFGAGSEQIIQQYTLSSGAALPGRMPTVWTFEGSQDASDWVTLDTRVNESGWSTGETRTYRFANANAYRYYRIHITGIDGGFNLRLYEIEMKEAQSVAVSSTVNAADVEAEYRWVRFDFPTPFDLDVNTPYWAVLETSDLLSETDAIEWGAAAVTYADDQTGSGTASASSELAGAEADKAFDDTGLPWVGGGGSFPVWLQYDFGAGNAPVIRKYQMRMQGGFPTRAPQDWTFEGSNNASDWTVLDTRSGETGWFENVQRSYIFENDTGYRYYRLNITDNNGDWYVALDDVQMMTLTTPETEYVPGEMKYHDGNSWKSEYKDAVFEMYAA